MKKVKAILLIVLIAVICTACGSNYLSVGSVEVETSTKKSMTYKKFNGVREYSLKVKAGQEIMVEIESEDGKLNAYITKKGSDKKDAIYEGNDIKSSSFTVTPDEEGIYIIHLEADNHKGSYSFELKE